jgi:hypothetical protein
MASGFTAELPPIRLGAVDGSQAEQKGPGVNPRPSELPV